MSEGSNNRTLITAIIIAALAISGAVVYHAVTVDSRGLEISESDLDAKINQLITKKLTEGDFLSQPIAAGIEEFVRKQREAQNAAREQQQNAAAELAKNVRRASMDRDHVLGSPDAEISLIEYSDFECPFCKRFHGTPKELIEKYDGEVNWVYRHFPLDFHNPGAQKQAEASECASELGGNPGFWKYAALLYERTTSNGKGFPLEKLVPLAEEIGLNGGKFQECLDSGRMTTRVQEDYEEGARIGINGTPGSIILNNKTGKAIPRSGAIPLAALEAVVQELLN